MKESRASWSFFFDLLPLLVTWATDCTVATDFVLLEPKKGKKNLLSPNEARRVLANSFFLNLHNLRMTLLVQKKVIGALDFHALYREKKYKGVAVQKILCLLAYFVQAPELPNRNIEFERQSIVGAPKWEDVQGPINVSLVSVQSEPSDMTTVVDFYTPDVHNDAIQQTMTLEEVIFSCCPEAALSLLFTEQLLPDEVMVIKGVKIFSKYKGYIQDFKFDGFFEGNHDIINIVRFDENQKASQFNPQTIDRDLNKSWKGFSIIGNEGLITTGYWDAELTYTIDPVLRFLQQVYISSVTGTVIEYSTFGDGRLKQFFELLLQEMETANITRIQLYQIMAQYHLKDPENQMSFRDFALEAIRSKVQEGDWTYHHLLIGGTVVLAAGFVQRLVSMAQWARS